MIIREEAKHFDHQVRHGIPKLRVSHRDYEGKVASPRLRAVLIGPLGTSLCGAVCGVNVTAISSRSISRGERWCSRRP